MGGESPHGTGLAPRAPTPSHIFGGRPGTLSVGPAHRLARTVEIAGMYQRIGPIQPVIERASTKPAKRPSEDGRIRVRTGPSRSNSAAIARHSAIVAKIDGERAKFGTTGTPVSNMGFPGPNLTLCSPNGTGPLKMCRPHADALASKFDPGEATALQIGLCWYGLDLQSISLGWCTETTAAMVGCSRIRPGRGSVSPARCAETDAALPLVPTRLLSGQKCCAGQNM